MAWCFYPVLWHLQHLKAKRKYFLSAQMLLKLIHSASTVKITWQIDHAAVLISLRIVQM